MSPTTGAGKLVREPQLAIVTLAMNNVDEVFRTLTSVVHQSERPDTFLVVDSSSPDIARLIEKAAHHVGATYKWIAPDGVYPAMNEALALLDPADFVWFVNSSDWLYGPESVKMMKSALRHSVADWAIGGLHRYGDVRVPFHPVMREGESTLQAMIQGKMGFAHPSAAMRKQSIDALGGFDTHYAIAADYDLALRFFTKCGPPHILPEVVSVHQPTGLTSRNRVRHALEKSRIRRTVTKTPWVSEAGKLVRLALTSALRRHATHDALEPVIPVGFCGGVSSEGALNCCVDWLDARALELFRW